MRVIERRLTVHEREEQPEGERGERRSVEPDGRDRRYA
jgi:hypothetical protein